MEIPGSDYQDHRSTLGTIILMSLAFMSEISRRITHNLLDNYDTYFKLLTLALLAAGIATYVVKWINGSIKLLRDLLKQLDKKIEEDGQ